MYDFLLRGDKSKDIRLQPEDVIFIPPIGPMAAIGSPKTIKEIEESLRSLARLQLEEEPSGQAQWIYSKENWRRKEDLKIISPRRATPKEQEAGTEINLAQSRSPSRLLKSLKETDLERIFGMSLRGSRTKTGHEQGHGFRWGG